ncbi:MAG: zinc-ribbon domain-containing protein [Promethearchaeota archaeon]
MARYKYEEIPYFFIMVAVGFLIVGVLNTAQVIDFGAGWWYFPVIFCSFISIVTLYQRYQTRKAVLGTLRLHNRTTIGELARELEMKEKDVKRTVVDLRAEGRLVAAFDPKTGEVILGDEAKEYREYMLKTPKRFDEIQTQPTAAPQKAKGKAESFCPYCGSPASADAMYCSYCGHRLE